MWKYSEELDTQALLQREQPVLIVKHSNSCSISSMALNRLVASQQNLDAASEVVLVDVIKNRSTSLRLADELGVRHESPQVILLSKGEVVYTASHFDIRPEKILSQL